MLSPSSIGNARRESRFTPWARGVDGRRHKFKDSTGRVLVVLIGMTTRAVRVSAQVYPYRDGTPGVTGYRSEVMAEVMIQESEFVRFGRGDPCR